MSKANDIVKQLRNIAAQIERNDINFPLPDPDPTLDDESPFVAAACDAIEHGGHMEAIELGSLIHYIADMMEE